MKSNNKSYERCMFNKIKPIYTIYFLHILQGQVLGFHTLISLLNSCKDLQFLIFLGTMPHILGPRNLTDWKLHGDLYFGVLLNNDLLQICVINIASIISF